MKKSLLILGLLVFVLACKNNGDKQSQLDKLRKDKESIDTQIKKLEDEIAKESGATKSEKLANVALTDVKLGDFKHFVEVQGKVDGEDNVAVNAQTMGIIKKINVKEGDVVSAGQTLAEIDASVLKQSIEEVKLQLNFATTMYNKQKALWDQKIGSEVQYLSAKNNKESLENRIKTLLEQVDMSKIVSPINGSVEEISLKVGQSAAPGFPLFRVVNFSKIKVLADVAEAYSSKIRKGDEVFIRFPDVNKEISSNVSFTSKYISPNNRTFMVEIRLAPGDIEYRANMIAVVKINDYSAKNVITVPINVIQTDVNNAKFLFIGQTAGNKTIAKKVTVKTGQTYNGIVEILDGLKEGDKLISVGYQDVEDGQALKM